MRKTILMLINGFGIERKDSVEVFTEELMPNLNDLTKNYLFSSLQATAGDYNSGYKSFSMLSSNKKKEDKIDDMIYDKSIYKNEILKRIGEGVTSENKLHIFYPLDTGYKFHQIKEILRVINENKDKQVFIHLIMTSSSVEDYNDIVKTISKISFETSSYVKIGFIVGKNKVNSDDVLRTFYKEFGEHWNESTKKFDIFKKEIINPEDAGVFYINKGFSLTENDTVLFMNFQDIDMDRFYDDFTKIPLKKYSLFEYKEGVEKIFDRDLDETSSMSTIIEKHNIKLLVLTDKSKINDINFYLNGMKKVLSKNITYAINDISLFDTKEKVIDLISSPNYDGFILDYNIGTLNKLDEIKNTLSKIDAIIKPISDASREKDYTFIISSVYGMYKEVLDGVVPKVVNFAGKVPVIYQNNEYNRQEYTLSGGDTYGLGLTYLTNICDDVKSNKIVKKLSSIDKMLSKK